MTEPQKAQISAPEKIDALIASLDDWRGELLARIRRLIRAELPDVEETWKWMGSPVWEHNGIVAVGNAHKAKVKLTFPQGAQLVDSGGVFNAGLGGKAWRAIDLGKGDSLDEAAFRALVREAAEFNAASKGRG
ncbi:DUF1801 domain-containing protein [Brevibacterium daeguense]|uniref:DUF1801 domain-containing protein n=1 Tax=Brevibacterium daeguense TaxID=909936 RepID=A0ABP8EIM8_9MICO|nr:DUF1801 domain-containing protein [Brevibacterium daeguense]